MLGPQPLRFHLALVSSVCLGLLFAVIPLGPELDIFRPELLCLVVIFWLLHAPAPLGLAFAFVVGLAQDVAEFGIWGAHAFALVILSYLLLNAKQRLKTYALWQQSLWIAVLIGVHQVLVNWVQGMAGYGTTVPVLLASIASTALIWPVFDALAWRLGRSLRLF
ncbi:rod shape-determining protein MreD [Agaribacterium haliotis]|uniref:rod shape-determining protein MreD n=1 Tax=Agaribacterium haliotis TaxID=2013869 RepID=UPI000BB54343|nr:rod shape-determining protein MreD [Agaribacterium haliotis]